MNNKKLLLVFENKLDGKSLQELLESWGYIVFLLTSPEIAIKMINSENPHIIIIESKFEKIDSIELLKTIKSTYEIPVIFMEKEGSIEQAVLALKIGAHDYFSQPLDIVRLNKVLENISRNLDIIEEAFKLKEQLNNLRSINSQLIGSSPKMNEIFNQIEICAPSQASVFITGSSGTGKELVARAIHNLSPRRNGHFIAINCSAIPENLLESEIFGHEKGSFTGAIKRKEGCFELANNGTFFLDEITEMAPDLQSKLLRVLENGTFRRVGGTEEISSNVRVLTASNSNVVDAIKAGRFREDLYYRLNVFLLELPSLKDRTSDIPLLVQHFIEEFNLKTNKNILSATPEVFEILKSYDWPGNVRELKNVVERAVILTKTNVIDTEDLPQYIYKKHEQQVPILTVEVGTTKIDNLEKMIIVKTLEHLKGNKTEAAKILGLSLKTLYNKLNSINYQSPNSQQ